MPNILRRLKIFEVSGVDRGAGEGVKVMLMKRDGTCAGCGGEGGKHKAGCTAKADDDATDTTFKGARNIMDWLKRLAERHGLTKADALSFDQAIGAVQAGDYARDMLESVGQAMSGLRQSVYSILEDEAVTDKRAMLETTFEQFKAHMQGIVPAEMEKALTAAGLAAGLSASLNEGEDAMKPETLAKIRKALNLKDDAGEDALAEAIIKAAGGEKKDDADKIAKLENELALSKLSKDENDYCAAVKMSEADKLGFAKKAPAEREAFIKANPAKPIVMELPADVQKRLADGEAALARVAKLEDATQLAAIEKRVTAWGGTEADAKHIHDIHKVDPKLAEATETRMKALQAQVKTGALFNEVGKSGHAAQGGDAYAQLMAKADELRKTQAGAGLTVQQAFAKVYADPANRELVELNKREERERSKAAAA